MRSLTSLATGATSILPLMSSTRASRRSALGLGPSSLTVGSKTLAIGESTHAASFAVADYPAEVGNGWLEPLLSFPARIDVAIHIEPVSATVAAERLRKQRARLESGRRLSAERGRLDDPLTESTAADARELAYRLACGEGKLFTVGIYLTVFADCEESLAETVSAVKAMAHGMLLRLVPATYRTVQGWTTTLPLGLDGLRIRRTFDTDALAACFPFTSDQLAQVAGSTTPVLIGMNGTGAGLVCFDRWALDNHNSVVLARSGAGKSYLTKLDILRSLYSGVQVMVVDPEQEYLRLAEAVGGTVIELGVPGTRINPFDLAFSGEETSTDAVRRRALFGHTVVSVLLGSELAPSERAALDTAILGAYEQAGITDDVRTHNRPAPTLTDVVEVLAMSGGSEAKSLAERLAPHTTGSFAGLFNGPTSTAAEGHLVVFVLKNLPEELKAIGTLLVLDAIWRQVTSVQRRRRLVVVDEAWLLMREPAGARFLFRMAKAARKHWAGLAVITQDAADLLGSDLGQAVVANAATQILLRQAPQSIEAVAAAFRLSEGERAYLLAAGRGSGLIAIGTSRAAFSAVASSDEHLLATTDPAELALIDASREDEEPADGDF